MVSSALCLKKRRIKLDFATSWARLPRQFALGRSTTGRTAESKYFEAFGPKKLQSRVKKDDDENLHIHISIHLLFGSPC